MTLWKNLVVALVAAFALAACSSSNDNGDSTSGETPPPEPTAAESQMTLIENAQAGLDTALDGLDADDPTAGQIEAVNSAISLLANALAGANDLSPNDTEEARGDLDNARMAARDAQTTLSTGMATETRIMMQMEAIADAQEALSDALDGEEISDIGAANEAYDDLNSAIEAGEDLTAAEMASAVSDLNMADVQIANAELAMYENAAMADGASLAQMLAAYEGKLTAARRLASAMAASEDDLEKANQAIGSATTKIAQLKEDIQDVADDAADKMRMANNDRAMEVAEAINAHTTATTPDATPDIAHDEVPFAPVISRTVGSADIKLGQRPDPATEDQYKDYSAPMIGDDYWSEAGFMREVRRSGGRTVEEVVAIYTDIEAAENALWTDYWDGDGKATAAEQSGQVRVSATDRAGRFVGILPPRPEIHSTQRAISQTDTAIRGSYYGVTGDFKCASDSCTVTRSSTDVVTVDGMLDFNPDADTQSAVAKLMAIGVVEDTDYTYFGYWMESKRNRDGSFDHDIETFHGGAADEGAPLALTGVEGTANYYGAAAGAYVKKDGTDDSLVVTEGKFTAVAELTARFGGDEIAMNDDFEVEGTISGFMDGSMDLGFAVLTLRGNDADGAGIEQNAGDAVGSFTGETDGGGTSGRWAGRFYGNVGSGTTEVLGDNYPMNVSGEFNGHFVNGHVAGAFGAEYDD